VSALRPEELDVLREFRAAVSAALPGLVREVRLFGSRARGEARPDSDWDIAVIMDDQAARNISVRDTVSDTALEFLMRGWPIHEVVMSAEALEDGAWRADAVGDTARHGIRVE
jgi:uncharacterized protein